MAGYYWDQSYSRWCAVEVAKSEAVSSTMIAFVC